MFELVGSVTGTKGPLLLAELYGVPMGSFCTIEGNSPLLAKVVGFHGATVQLAPFGNSDGVAPNAVVRSFGDTPTLSLQNPLQGSVIDAMGRRLIGSPASMSSTRKELVIYQEPIPSLHRPPLSQLLPTGIRVIDTLAPIARGQRMGLIAPAGAGKSTLLSILAQQCEADIIVIALVGERGREVREFLELTLTESLKEKSVVVVSTSDEAPMLRATAPFTATAVAEYYRDQGKNVLLLVDSLTRTARAIRDVGLSSGELPVRHGYTPSVYTALPQLLERAGTSETGSITAIYTLLGNEEGSEDPLAEEVKSLLDGHWMLSRRVAQKGIRPALDPLRSLSRIAERLLPDTIQHTAALLMRLLERLEKDRDLVTFGGTPDAELACALFFEGKLEAFRGQSAEQRFQRDASYAALIALGEEISNRLAHEE